MAFSRSLRAFLAFSLIWAIFLSKRSMAFSRSLRAFLAFSLIWAALAAMCLLVCLILAFVAEARAARARCWLDTASCSCLAAWALFLRMISRVLRERAMVARLRLFSRSANLANLAWTMRMSRSKSSFAFLALMAILASSAFFILERAAWLYAKFFAICARTAAMSALRPATSLAICLSTLFRKERRRWRPSGVFVMIRPAFFTSTDSMDLGSCRSNPAPMSTLDTFSAVANTDSDASAVMYMTEQHTARPQRSTKATRARDVFVSS